MVAIVLKNAPSKEVNLKFDEPSSTFRLEENKIRELEEGDVHIKLTHLSNDPTQRQWMAKGQNKERAYVPPIEEGEIIRSLGLAKVIESRSDKYAKGDHVVGLFGWAEELVVKDTAITTKIDTSLAPELYLSSIGMTGLTAYFGLKEIGLLKEGQTILISAASGATGSMAVQLAKHVFKASKVIGIAGSDEKVEWVKSLGADYCANYREADWMQKLDAYIGKDYVDVYWDNVGGESLDFALTHTKRYGRIIACGAIAGYNDPSKFIIKRWPEIVINRLTAQGFIVFDFVQKFPEGISVIGDAIKKGQIKGSEGVSLIDVHGNWEKVPETWFKLFTEEKPKGKLVTKL